MKIIRHIAPDMRQAMRSIRAQLGEDAVILSSRKIPEGVEVTAAVDFDAASLHNATSSSTESLAPSPLPPPAAPVSAPRALTPPSREATPSYPAAAAVAATVSAPAYGAVPASLLAAPAPAPAWTQEEVAALRRPFIAASPGRDVPRETGVLWPGDIVRADANGIVCIPSGRLAETVQLASEVLVKENNIKDQILSGRTIFEIFQLQQYVASAQPQAEKKI